MAVTLSPLSYAVVSPSFVMKRYWFSADETSVAPDGNAVTDSIPPVFSLSV